MALAGLQNVKLKKTVVKEKPVDPASHIQLCQSSEEYHALMEAAYLEAYLEPLAPFTFKSLSFALSELQIRALLAGHKKYLETKSIEGWRNDAALASIAAEVDKLKGDLACEEVFVRTSARSCKDASLDSSRFRDAFLAALARARKMEGSNEENAAVYALMEANVQGLCVASGEEAMGLLLRSARIQGDFDRQLELLEAERCGGAPAPPPFQLFVREFARFDVANELRAFVYKGKLTAMTQYEFAFFPGLAETHDAVRDVVTTFVANDLLPVLKDAGMDLSLTLDLVLVPPEDNPAAPVGDHRVMVIEINPLAEFAGSGLFSWVKDKAELLGMQLPDGAPIPFRVLTEPPQHQFANLPRDWKDILLTFDDFKDNPALQ